MGFIVGGRVSLAVGLVVGIWLEFSTTSCDWIGLPLGVLTGIFEGCWLGLAVGNDVFHRVWFVYLCIVWMYRQRVRQRYGTKLIPFSTIKPPQSYALTFSWGESDGFVVGARTNCVCSSSSSIASSSFFFEVGCNFQTQHSKSIKCILQETNWIRIKYSTYRTSWMQRPPNRRLHRRTTRLHRLSILTNIHIAIIPTNTGILHETPCPFRRLIGISTIIVIFQPISWIMLGNGPWFAGVAVCGGGEGAAIVALLDLVASASVWVRCQACWFEVYLDVVGYVVRIELGCGGVGWRISGLIGDVIIGITIVVPIILCCRCRRRCRRRCCRDCCICMQFCGYQNHGSCCVSTRWHLELGRFAICSGGIGIHISWVFSKWPRISFISIKPWSIFERCTFNCTIRVFCYRKSRRGSRK